MSSFFFCYRVPHVDWLCRSFHNVTVVSTACSRIACSDSKDFQYDLRIVVCARGYATEIDLVIDQFKVLIPFGHKY